MFESYLLKRVCQYSYALIRASHSLVVMRQLRLQISDSHLLLSVQSRESFVLVFKNTLAL